MAEKIEFDGGDKLLGGIVQPIVAKPAIVTGTSLLKRGTVLALVSVTNGIETLTPVASGGTGELAVPYAVLAEKEIAATAAGVPTAVYFTGEFAAEYLIFQGDDTVDDFAAAMRKNGMIVKTTI